MPSIQSRKFIFMEFKNPNRNIISNLVDPIDQSIFTECILSGNFGTIEVDDCNDPQIALLSFADVIIPVGDVRHSRVTDLINTIPPGKGIIAKNPLWKEKILDVLSNKIVNLERYSFSNENLNPKALHQMKSTLPEKFLIKRIDKNLAEKLTIEPPPLTRDHIFNFGTIERFLGIGFGYCILQGNEIVSAASTYAVSNSGIEIQVNTTESNRGNGLAGVVSASLILESIDRELVPHWDAANTTSARLAERLGFTPAGSYEMIVRTKP